jgi:hypothetical protein
MVELDIACERSQGEGARRATSGAGCMMIKNSKSRLTRGDYRSGYGELEAPETCIFSGALLPRAKIVLTGPRMGTSTCNATGCA